MKAKFVVELFNDTKSSFSIAKFKLCETVTTPDGVDIPEGKKISLKGYMLPNTPDTIYDFEGEWLDSKYGWTFAVSSYSEFVAPTENGIVKYLSSGQIKGIGVTIAKRIYDTFGDKTLDVLDKVPDKLLEIDGIGKKKLERIIDSYLENRGARDILQFLLPFGVTPKKAVRFYKEYGTDAIRIVKEKPYKLCELHGIGFKTADKIALKMGIDPLAEDRIDNAVLYVLSNGEIAGNTCLPISLLVKDTLDVLNTEEITSEMIEASVLRLEIKNRIINRNECYFLNDTNIREKRLADNLKAHVQGPAHLISDPHQRKDFIKQVLGFSLSDEQLEAVKSALTNPITVITGGPGTGKTAIQKAIISLFQMDNPTGSITCCSPTGKAARRMTEATGHHASTIHRAIGLVVDEDGYYGNIKKIESDLIIVDEVSMMDNLLADALFRAVKSDEQRIVLVGDVDQLPSVGAGQVLKDIIDSGVVPVVRLEKVFRQEAGSTIAINAQKIRHVDHNLKYDDDFALIDDFVNDDEAQRIIVSKYVEEAKRIGIDNVVFLTPYKKRTATGTMQINPVLRDKLNPASPIKPEITIGSQIFRKGDKVIQTKNHDDIANGDIGYILDIVIEDHEKLVEIDFGDDRVVFYSVDDMKDIELAYALTVHKAQGSEYKSVIMTLQNQHYIMLLRPLIYTAITRARENVTIVGEKRAIMLAVHSESKEKRFTGLLDRLKQ